MSVLGHDFVPTGKLYKDQWGYDQQECICSVCGGKATRVLLPGVGTSKWVYYVGDIRTCSEIVVKDIIE